MTVEEPPQILSDDTDCPRCGEGVWLLEDSHSIWGCLLCLYACSNLHRRITVTPPEGVVHRVSILEDDDA